jgi:hypothetical protein
MELSTNSASDSQSTIDSLSYINDLVVDACNKGQYRIFVESFNMNDNMMQVLINTYEYNVTKKTNDIGTHVTYIIDWSNVSTPILTETPTPTITPTPTPTTTSNGEFIYTAQSGIAWNGYGSNYLSFGRSQDGTNKTPLAGWYFRDSNNVVRQLLNSPVWFSNGNPSPWPNGNGWIAVANGSFSISASQTTITFYETSPV